jgi:GT2 family glycosyltransferase
MVGLPKDGSKSMDAFYVSGCSMLFRKDLYEKIGGFDEKYFLYKDDLDFCWRARLLGYRVVTDLESKVHHVSGVVAGGRTVLDEAGRYHTTARKRYFGERNTLRTLLKNYSALVLLRVLPVYFLMIFLEVVFFALTRNARVSVAYLRAMWWNIQNLGDTLLQRKKIQSLRVVSDGAIMKDMIKGSSKLNYFKTIKAPIFEGP